MSAHSWELSQFPAPLLGDGGCTNSLTPTKPYSLQACVRTCVCACVRVCVWAAAAWTAVCSNMLHPLWHTHTHTSTRAHTHTQGWAQTAPLKSVSNLGEPAEYLWLSWETPLKKCQPKEEEQPKRLRCNNRVHFNAIIAFHTRREAEKPFERFAVFVCLRVYCVCVHEIRLSLHISRLEAGQWYFHSGSGFDQGGSEAACGLAFKKTNMIWCNNPSILFGFCWLSLNDHAGQRA